MDLQVSSTPASAVPDRANTSADDFLPMGSALHRRPIGCHERLYPAISSESGTMRTLRENNDQWAIGDIPIHS
ncbi:hypothetical protein ASG84_06050 [Rhodococcus sp. Leaf278]|nr:hypothetical protein ASG84_06050 [Rhodococcus sp. Leaf278]